MLIAYFMMYSVTKNLPCQQQAVVGKRPSLLPWCSERLRLSLTLSASTSLSLVWGLAD